jgi:hypothetical protein
VVPAKPSPPATDFAEIARATFTAAIDPAMSEDPDTRRKVVLDAIDATDAGARIDAKAAPWDELREQLRLLLRPPPKQQNQQQQQQQDKKDKGSGSRKDSQSQNQPPDNSKQDQNPQQKSNQGEQNQGDGERQDKPAQGQSLAGLTNNAPQKAREPKEEKETQRVGGKPTQTHQEARANPELAEALRRFEKARNLDSPARLAHILDEMDGRTQETTGKGKDW